MHLFSLVGYWLECWGVGVLGLFLFSFFGSMGGKMHLFSLVGG